MKALIQKDLRENLKVALIGLLIFSLMLLQAYQTSVITLTCLLAGIEADEGVLQPLLSQSLLAETAFFSALFGAALGWLQIRNEAHRDLWAFLIHRPVTRAHIFLGKTIAGLCLYLLGAGLPLAIFVAIVRVPGHVAAPFEWAMVLPLVSIFLMGVGFYFAGLLTGLRQARWYASRGFGLALAILASLGVFNFPEFWQPLILIALAVVILATAVWGGYQSGGFYRGQPGTGRLALTVAMTAGCGLFLYIGVGLISSFVFNPLSARASVRSGYQMTTDGSLYKETFLNGELVEIADLEGHPLLDPQTGRKMERLEIEKRTARGSMVWTDLKYRGNRNDFRSDRRFFSLWTITDNTLWYLDRHGELNGYDGLNRKHIASLDAPGSNGTLRSQPFLSLPDAGNYYMSSDRKLIATARVLYQADFKARTLKPVFSLTNDDQICGFCGYAGPRFYGDENGQTKSISLTTQKTVRLLDSEGRPVFVVPYQPGYVEYPYVELRFLQATNGSTANFAVWFHPDDEMNRKSGGKMPIHVIWVGPGQTVAKSADLPALGQPDNPPSWLDKLALTMLPPPAHLAFDNNIFSPWNVLSFALAFMSALIGWSLLRRYDSSPKTILGWTLFVFLLGLGGLLTLLCVQEWPAREACPHCKKLRAVDRELCPHCQSPFPPPEKNGTEIFAPLAKAD